jgi:hypothetical protein
VLKQLSFTAFVLWFAACSSSEGHGTSRENAPPEEVDRVQVHDISAGEGAPANPGGQVTLVETDDGYGLQLDGPGGSSYRQCGGSCEAVCDCIEEACAASAVSSACEASASVCRSNCRVCDDQCGAPACLGHDALCFLPGFFPDPTRGAEPDDPEDGPHDPRPGPDPSPIDGAGQATDPSASTPSAATPSSAGSGIDPH